MTVPHNAIRRIQRRTAEAFGVRVKDILGRSRLHKFVRARQAAMYLARSFTPHSTEVIGRLFHRDRTTVVHSVNRIPVFMEYEEETGIRVIALTAALLDEFEGVG